jgi:hypothetical protein
MKDKLTLGILGVGLLGLFYLATACGDMPIKKALPDNIQKIVIPVFENKTGQPDVENLLTKKVVQNFIVDGRLQVTSREQADAQLQGTVQRYDRIVLTRDANQVPQQYKLQIVVDIDFTELKTGTLMWSTKSQLSLTPGVEGPQEGFDSTNLRSLREFTNYYVINVAGVPPEDEATALDRVLEQMAQRVSRRTLDGF